MPSVIVDLRISYEEFLKFYQGIAYQVEAKAEDGRKVQFPARVLRPYVVKHGIDGRFKIDYDHTGKFQAIQKI